MTGLECHLALGGTEPESMDGNLLLDTFFNAQIHWCGEQRKGETIPDICKDLQRNGRNPYVVPYGGSNAVGALGFVAAAEEFCNQSRSLPKPFTHIVFASSSGGTHAGLVTGAAVAGLECELIGIAIDKEGMEGVSLYEYIVRLAGETARRCGYDSTPEPPTLIGQYTGAGYGMVGDMEREALRLCASLEGILLDPVYTGRAMGGMIDLVRKGFFSADARVLFWHTGGTPALFPYRDDLVEK
jgi:D-cysteine desulfhydrase